MLDVLIACVSGISRSEETVLHFIRINFNMESSSYSLKYIKLYIPKLQWFVDISQASLGSLSNPWISMDSIKSSVNYLKQFRKA